MSVLAHRLTNLLIRRTNENVVIWQPAGECGYAAGYLIWIFRLEWKQYIQPTTLIVKNHSFSGLREYEVHDKHARIFRLRQAVMRQHLRLKGGEYSRVIDGHRTETYDPNDHEGALASAVCALGGSIRILGRE